MSMSVTWLADDPCPACGATLIDLSADAHRLGQECRVCGWAVIWDLDGGEK